MRLQSMYSLRFMLRFFFKIYEFMIQFILLVHSIYTAVTKIYFKSTYHLYMRELNQSDLLK